MVDFSLNEFILFAFCSLYTDCKQQHVEKKTLKLNVQPPGKQPVNQVNRLKKITKMKMAKKNLY